MKMTLYIENFEEYCRYRNTPEPLVCYEDMHGVSCEMELTTYGAEQVKKYFTQVFNIKGYRYVVRLNNTDIDNKEIVGNFIFE